MAVTEDIAEEWDTPAESWPEPDLDVDEARIRAVLLDLDLSPEMQLTQVPRAKMTQVLAALGWSVAPGALDQWAA